MNYSIDQRSQDMGALLGSTNLRVTQLTPTIGAGPTAALLLPANPRRYYLMMCDLLATAIIVWPGEISHNEGGVTLVQNLIQEFWWFKHGPIVQAAWFITGTPGVQQVAVWEQLLN